MMRVKLSTLGEMSKPVVSQQSHRLTREDIVVLYICSKSHCDFGADFKEGERHIDGQRFGAWAASRTCLRQRHQARGHVYAVRIWKDHDLF